MKPVLLIVLAVALMGLCLLAIRKLKKRKARKMTERGEKVVVQKRGVRFIVTAHPFWIRKYPRWEETTFDVFDHFLSREATFLDIGAWIGSTCLYAGTKSKRVIALEPDPKAFLALEENVRLNPELPIEAVQAALTGEDGPVPIYSKALADSKSSLLEDRPGLSAEAVSVSVEGITPESLAGRFEIEELGFAKMDIEGGEKMALPVLLPFLERMKAPLLVSLHPHLLSREDIDELNGLLAATFPFRYQVDLRSEYDPGVSESGGHAGIDVVGTWERIAT